MADQKDSSVKKSGSAQLYTTPKSGWCLGRKTIESPSDFEKKFVGFQKIIGKEIKLSKIPPVLYDEIKRGRSAMTFHTPEDIAAVLKIKPSTLRKYSLLLEQSGYSFQKNAHGHRWYSDKDLIALRKFITFKDSGGMTLEASADAVFLWSKNGDVADRATLPVAIQSDMERYEEPKKEMVNEDQLLKLLHHQQQTIDQMAQALQKQEEQNGQILEEMKNLRNQLQQLNAPSSDQSKIEGGESPPQQTKKDTRGLWARIWNKGN